MVFMSVGNENRVDRRRQQRRVRPDARFGPFAEVEKEAPSICLDQEAGRQFSADATDGRHDRRLVIARELRFELPMRRGHRHGTAGIATHSVQGSALRGKRRRKAETTSMIKRTAATMRTPTAAASVVAPLSSRK